MTNTNMDDFAADLAEFDNAFEEAEVKEKQDVPDGTYTVFVDKAEMKKTKTSNENMFALQLKIMEGPQKNRMLFKNQVINNVDRVKYLKGDLATMDIILTKLSDLPSRCKDILDLKLIVQQKTKGEYTNVYINKCEGKIDSSESNAGGIGTGFDDGDFVSDEDIPF